MITNEKIIELSKYLDSNRNEFNTIVDIFKDNDNVEYKIKKH